MTLGTYLKQYIDQIPEMIPTSLVELGAGKLATLNSLDLGSNYVTGRLTYGKMPQVAAGKLIGNPTGSAVDAQEIALGTGLAFAGGALVASPNAPNATVSASLTLDATYRTVFVDASAGPVTLTLPDPVSFKNTTYTVKKVDATLNAVTLAGTVDGRANYSTTTPNDSATVQAAGSAGWYIIA